MQDFRLVVLFSQHFENLPPLFSWLPLTVKCPGRAAWALQPVSIRLQLRSGSRGGYPAHRGVGFFLCPSTPQLARSLSLKYINKILENKKERNHWAPGRLGWWSARKYLEKEKLVGKRAEGVSYTPHSTDPRKCAATVEVSPVLRSFSQERLTRAQICCKYTCVRPHFFPVFPTTTAGSVLVSPGTSSCGHFTGSEGRVQGACSLPRPAADAS